MNLPALKPWLFAAAVLLYFVPLVTQPAGNAMKPVAMKPLPALKTGDLIVIRGRSFLSGQLRKLNRHDQRYSHCGLVIRQQDTSWVYHLTGGAGHIPTGIQRQPLDSFISPANTIEFGIYRYKLPDTSLQSIAGKIIQWKNQGVTFDYQFELETDATMYCSELIFKAIKSMEDDFIMVNLDNVNGKKYITIDNLYINPHTSKIYDYAYN